MIAPTPFRRYSPQSKRRERRAVTVCIGALCLENDLEPSIVLCRDWRGELQGVGATDEVYKLKRLSYRWVALIAGNTSRADELCLRLEYAMRETPLTEQNIANEIRKVYSDFKRSLADSFLKRRFGISMDTLIDKGVSAFGETFVKGCFDEISQLSVGVELIVAGFIDTFDYDDKESALCPILCSLSELNEGDPVVLEDEYSAIGSGANAARTVLCSRHQNAVNPLMQTVYTVYEAKRMSETVPGVGETYSIDILSFDGTLKAISEAGSKRMHKLFSRFGPRPIAEKPSKKPSNWFKIDQSYFEPWVPMASASQTLEDQQ